METNFNIQPTEEAARQAVSSAGVADLDHEIFKWSYGGVSGYIARFTGVSLEQKKALLEKGFRASTNPARPKVPVPPPLSESQQTTFDEFISAVLAKNQHEIDRLVAEMKSW